MKEMKNALIVITALALTLSACKKDYLTKEELQEELANQEQPNNDLPNWELLESGATYNHKGTNNNFWSYNNKVIIEGYNIFESSWRNNHHELVIDLDTTGLGSQNYNNLMTNNFAPYLKQMYTSNKFYDVLEIIEITSTKATFYSKELQEFIQTQKL